MATAATTSASKRFRAFALACAGAQLALVLALGLGAVLAQPVRAPEPLPESLRATGLFLAGGDAIDPRNLLYVPQYPLWSDGARKRRFVRFPEGAAIDARDPDRWQLPAGTRFWKEFSFGTRVETRFIEVLPDRGVRFATYVWLPDGSDAILEREGAHVATAAGTHEVPRQADCSVCHEGRRGSILGFNALQLSGDRDPNALHREPLGEGALDLRALAARDLLRDFPQALLREPPRIASRTARERAALGYLYGNCSGCHNDEGPIASLGLDLDQRAGVAPRALSSAVNVRSQFRIPQSNETLRIAPGRAEASALAYRMSSRDPATQMPPLGTRHVDDAALELVRAWIEEDLKEREKP